MPLGLFSSGKAQVLSDEKPAGSKKKEPKQLSENKCKGVTLKLDHTRVTIEKQIAEGGFAIVYVACDKKNNKYALKRQFTKENQKQLDACCREHSFLKQCIGHKNIVEFIDSYVNCLGNGIWECMLLTEYHQRNVLQLMNERIASNQFLTKDEILSIFCDLCEAVSFIHNRSQPIIHRDLKVENVLISSHLPPNYVLCDFGSATTQILSIDKFGADFVKSEVERNTTMCYRSPEMIDFYSGQVIGLKGDIWALGVLLYRLCFFCVPFEESPLAIQSVNYQFPTIPSIPEEIKGLIYALLDIDVNRRPSIFHTSVLAFEARGFSLPKEIKESQKSEPVPTLNTFVRLMKSGTQPRNRRGSSPRTVETPPIPYSTPVISDTYNPTVLSALNQVASGETSVAPRLRPKANNIVPNIPSISPVPPVGLPHLKLRSKISDEVDESRANNVPNDFRHRQSFSGEDQLKPTDEGSAGPLSCPLIKPSDLGFKDLDSSALPRVRAQTDGIRRIQHESDAVFSQQHRRNVSDTSQISRSAFKPYSSQQSTSKSGAQVRSVEDMSNRSNNGAAEWNPFLAAPFSKSLINQNKETEGSLMMDDSHFGIVFDEIRRREVLNEMDSDTSSIDSRDPFGAAPFDQLTVSTSSSAPPISLPPATEEDDERKLISDTDEDEKEGMDVNMIQSKKKIIQKRIAKLMNKE
uniref:non-specific serine/threonine protein kinase n=1 Tax=Caenorhabditis tropicalis TaxID=1561998 RepID=A0A1I7T2C6_9PELO